MPQSLWMNVGLFALAAGLILVVGPRLSRSAEQLAGVTGMAETLAGALFLGASTSLPGLIVSFQTAIGGRATLPLANSLGGIAAQTVFIALADVALRQDTIEHEDRLTASLMQSTVLITLLSLVLFAMFVPRLLVVRNVHPASPVIAVGVVLGFRVIQESRRRPQWLTTDQARDRDGSRAQGNTGDDRRTDAGGNGARDDDQHGSDDTRSSDDKHSRDDRRGDTGRRSSSGHGGGRDDGGSGHRRSRDRSPSTFAAVGRYLGYLVLVGAGGVTITMTGTAIIRQTGYSPLLVGMTGMAVATSLPELVTAVSSVRRGSIALAIGDIVGGNAFDTVMVAGADFVYREGPIYAAAIPEIFFLATVVVLMTGILLIGFIRRERRNLGNVGLESYLIGVIYGLGFALILLRKVTVPSG